MPMKYLMANTHLNLYDLVWLSPPTYGSYFPWLFGHGNVLVTQSLLCGGWCCVVRGVLWESCGAFQPHTTVLRLCVTGDSISCRNGQLSWYNLDSNKLPCSMLLSMLQKINLIEILKQATPIQFLACWLSDEKRYEWVSDLLIHAILFF